MRKLSCNPTRLSPSTTAFTLLEILASTAIIALLLVLITPLATSSFEKGREAACAANLRSLSAYFGMYAADNNGNILPYVNHANHLWPDIVAWNYMDSEVTSAADYKPFFCPSLEKRGYTFATRSPLNYRTNYAINVSVMQAQDTGINKLSLFSQPSRIGVIWDACTWPGEEPRMAVGALQEYHLTAGNPNCSVGWLHGRREKYPNRMGRANVLFLDGHVESQADPGTGNLLDIAVNWPNLYP